MNKKINNKLKSFCVDSKDMQVDEIEYFYSICLQAYNNNCDFGSRINMDDKTTRFLQAIKT